MVHEMPSLTWGLRKDPSHVDSGVGGMRALAFLSTGSWLLGGLSSSHGLVFGRPTLRRIPGLAHALVFSAASGGLVSLRCVSPSP